MDSVSMNKNITGNLCVCVCVCTFKFCSLRKFQLHNIVLLTVVTMLYIRFLHLHLITECLYPFTNLSLFPSSPNPRQQPFYPLAVTSFYVEVLEVHLCRVFKFNLRLNLLICFLLLMCTQHKIEKTSRGVLMLPSAWQCFGFLPPISASLFTFSLVA